MERVADVTDLTWGNLVREFVTLKETSTYIEISIKTKQITIFITDLDSFGRFT